MNNPLVSIVILNWNGWVDTIKCLESLCLLTYSNYEVVLVDNDSKDDSVKMIEAWILLGFLKGKIRFIKNSENYGFAKGNNIAIKKFLDEKRSEYILLLNNDTVVDSCFLDDLVKTMKADPMIGIVGPKIMNYIDNKQTDVIQSLGGKINLWTGNVDMICSNGKYSNTDVREVAYLRGAAIMIKTEVFESIGMLEEKYFAYFEETDFCFKAKLNRYSVKLVPSSVIWHKGMSSFNRVNGFSLYLMTRNLFWFEKRYTNKLQFLYFCLHFFLFKMPKKICYLIIFNKSNIKLLLNYYSGIKDGILKYI